MIKLRILEKMMQVVTTVSKFVRTVKDKVQKVSKKFDEGKKKVKLIKHKEVLSVDKQPVLPIAALTSKAKLFKQMIYLIKEDNIIYLHSSSATFKKQRTGPLTGKVVYIDFNYKKDWECSKSAYYNTQHNINIHSREPTHSSYGFLL